MRKLLLILTLLLTLGLMACNKEKTVTCNNGTTFLEWTWNENDGFTELKIDGVIEEDDAVDTMNEGIELSEYSTVGEFMDFFIGIAESEGYICD